MASEEAIDKSFVDREHQSAYIFDPSDEAERPTRPAKRRKVSARHDRAGGRIDHPGSVAAGFQPLFQGEEKEECVRLRQSLFEESWSRIDRRIDHVLRKANQSTLENVTSFVKDSETRQETDKIPSAFIITGANIASQELLFEQLAETLQEQADAKVVRLRSGDASNLKATLKKIIHDITARTTDDADDLEVSLGKDGRKYLNYDLEALHSHLKSGPRSHIVLCIQDSEAFDSGLLSDLILLLSSWLDRIPFVLLFGIATSVELFQARLLKSTCRHLYGDQFDVEQSSSVIEKIFRAAIAHVDTPLRLGPSLLQSLLERQEDQVAGIPVLVSSVKYAYMCHYYANPLSILLSDDSDGMLQEQHLELVRALPSFRSHIESTLDAGDVGHVRKLLDDDQHLISYLRDHRGKSGRWMLDTLRRAMMLAAGGLQTTDFVQLYLDVLANGIDVSEGKKGFIESVQRMPPPEIVAFLAQVLDTTEHGDESLGLAGWAEEARDTVAALSEMLAEVKDLQEKAEDNDMALKSRYSSHGKVLRTTVIAQKVQLSRDTADLTDEDKAYTKVIDRLVEHLESILEAPSAEAITFHETWLYDLKTPYRNVFIPRPRGVVERALMRPHDYLSCSCCKSGDSEIKSSLPATAILYHLYLETGSLINVADLWSAYFAVVGEDEENGLDERTALVMFYRALSELRIMGFIKQSRKKEDHIAKLAWHGL